MERGKKLVFNWKKYREEKKKFPNRGTKMAIIDIANVIGQIEGWNVAGSLAQRNNNPGNLIFVHQSGAVLGEGGFAKFSSPEAGFQALENQISLDASRGLDVTSFINKYAPPSENNTSNYISMFTSMLGVSATDKLSSLISGDGVVDASTSPITLGDEIGNIDSTILGAIAVVGIIGLVLVIK